MQLRIVNRDHNGFSAYDILSCIPDVVPFGPLEVAGLWLSHNNIPGLPDEYRDDLDDPPGTFPTRTVANFPNPQFAVVRFPSYRCDLNLTEPWLEIDLTELGAYRRRAKRLWYLDIASLPQGQQNSINQPGGEATLGANRLSAIKNKHNGLSITDVLYAGWDSATNMGSTRHRFDLTSTRLHIGVG